MTVVADILVPGSNDPKGHFSFRRSDPNGVTNEMLRGTWKRMRGNTDREIQLKAAGILVLGSDLTQS